MVEVYNAHLVLLYLSALLTDRKGNTFSSSCHQQVHIRCISTTNLDKTMKITSVKKSTSREETMAEEPVKGDDKTSSDVSEEAPVPVPELSNMSLFHQLFAPGTMETDVSEDSQYDSQDSRSQFTDMTGSLDEDEDDAHDDSTGEPSTSSTLIKFDRDLRARHRAACKNMTVRKEFSSMRLGGSLCCR